MMSAAEMITREYECVTCGEYTIVPLTIAVADIPDWLEEHGWTKVREDGEENEDGQYLCEDCDRASLAGDEGD